MNNDILEKTLTPSDGQSGSDLSLIRSHIFTYVATTLPSSARTLEVLTYNMVVKNQGAQYFNLGSLSLIVVKHNIAYIEPSLPAWLLPALHMAHDACFILGSCAPAHDACFTLGTCAA